MCVSCWVRVRSPACAASIYVPLRRRPATGAQVDWLFAEVGGREQLSALAQDPFGNFTLQKLLECGSQSLREALVAAVAGDVEAHTRHMYGCRVLQKLLEARRPAAQCACRDGVGLRRVCCRRCSLFLPRALAIGCSLLWEPLKRAHVARAPLCPC